MHLGNHRLGQGRDHLHHRATAGEQIQEVRGALVQRLTRGLHLLEIMPGTERLACAAKNDDASHAIIGQSAER